jgi:hypothetical protein
MKAEIKVHKGVTPKEIAGGFPTSVSLQIEDRQARHHRKEIEEIRGMGFPAVDKEVSRLGKGRMLLTDKETKFILKAVEAYIYDEKFVRAALSALNKSSYPQARMSEALSALETANGVSPETVKDLRYAGFSYGRQD